MIKFQRKWTPSFPSHESIVPRNARKQRRWEIINTLLCRWGYGWNFFAQLFLLISSVSTEQSQICEEYGTCQTRTGRPVLAGQSDPLFEPARLFMTTPTPSTEVPAQEILSAKVQRTSGEALTTRPIVDLYWCRIPENR